MTSTESRRRLVMRLVTTDTIESQAQLRQLLAQAGHVVTQATISRDLEAIGASKASEGGIMRYGIRDPEDLGRARSALANAVDEFVESVAVTGPLVIVRVPPGAAHLVGGRIDAAAIPNVLGTIAGDDTVFIAVDEPTNAVAVAADLERG